MQALVVSAFTATPHARSLRLITDDGIQAAWLRNGIIPFQIASGQVWNFTGEIVDLGQYGEQFEIRQAVPALPSGLLVVSVLARHVPGLSQQRARRMWEILGNGLLASMDNSDVSALARALGGPTAVPLATLTVRAWADLVAYTGLAQELYQYAFTEPTLRTVVGHYGRQSLAEVRDDPYRLLAFAKLEPVDRAALEHFGLGMDDERRLMGTVDATVHEFYDRGIVIFTQGQLETAIRELPNLQGDRVAAAINLAAQRGRLVAVAECHLMGDGFARIARAVVQFLASYIHQRPGTTAAPSHMGTHGTGKVGLMASEAAAEQISIILAHEEILVFQFVKCIAALFCSRDEGCYIVAGSYALCQRIDAATGLQPITLQRAAAAGLGKQGEVLSPRAIVIVSSTIDFVAMARLLPQLRPTDRLLFVGRPLRGAGDRMLLLPALLSVDQVFRRELSSNTIDDPAAAATHRCVPSQSVATSAFLPRESDRQGVFWICVADDEFERAVVGVSHQLRRHGSVAIVARDGNEQRHYAQLIHKAIVDTGASGLGTVSVVTADSLEPGDSDSTVVVLRQPTVRSATWLQMAVETAGSRAVIVATVELGCNLSISQDEDFAPRDFATYWFLASTEQHPQGQHE